MSDDPREQAIRSRLAGISSPAPWSVFTAEEISIESDEGASIVDMLCSECDADVEARAGDAHFIAHAPSDVAYLLSALSSSRSREQAAIQERDAAVRAHNELGERMSDQCEGLANQVVDWHKRAETAEQREQALRERLARLLIMMRSTVAVSRDFGVKPVSRQVVCDTIESWADELAQPLPGEAPRAGEEER